MTDEVEAAASEPVAEVAIDEIAEPPTEVEPEIEAAEAPASEPAETAELEAAVQPDRD